MCYFISPHDERQKMTENINKNFDADNAQLKALMHVIDEITKPAIQLVEPQDLPARSTLRALQWAIDDLNVLDDGDLVDTLTQAQVEVKHLLSVIAKLRTIISRHNGEIDRMQLLNRHAQTEVTRLENLVQRAN